jgi:hypothetical protein
VDPAPKSFEELPADGELGLPVPFGCGTGEPDAPPSARTLDHRRVTQCALSRICGVCGSGLGRPIAFLGSRREVDRNAFHFPPSHLECAERLLSVYAVVDLPVLGQPEPVSEWVLVTTAAFEYVRPAKEDEDRRATFQPNSILETRTFSPTRP